MKEICYISFVSEMDKGLLHLHSEAIRKFDKENDIIYFSEDEIEVPTGTKTIKGISIPSRVGYKNLSTLLTILSTLAEQYKTIVFSNPTCYIINDSHFIEYIQQRHALTWFCIDGKSMTPNTSCFVIASEAIKPLTEALAGYYDTFDSRNALEVILGYIMLISHPSQLAMAFPIEPDGKHATTTTFTSDLFGTPEKFSWVSSFIECGHMAFLQPYVNSHLDVFTQIKRAMRFISHFFKKNLKNSN